MARTTGRRSHSAAEPGTDQAAILAIVRIPVGGRGFGTGRSTLACTVRASSRARGGEAGRRHGAHPPHAAGRPGEALVDRLRALGHDVTHVPLVAIEPFGDDPVDVDVLRLGRPDERQRRARAQTQRCAVRRARSRRSGRATADAFGAPTSSRRGSTQEGLLEALPRPCGRVLFAGGRGRAAASAGALGADTVALYRTVELTPADWPSADLVVLLSASAARAYGRVRRRSPAVVDRPGDDAGRRGGGLRWWSRLTRATSTASSRPSSTH